MNTLTRINVQTPEPCMEWLRGETAKFGIKVPEVVRPLLDKARRAL